MSAPDPNIRRAYRALLGDDYERSLMDHVTISSLAETFAMDFDSAWDWQVRTLEEVIATMPPHAYQPVLITDKGSVVIPPDAWFHGSPGVGKRIAEFVAAVRATFLVLSYASSSGARTESFTLLGSDGLIAREAHWHVEHKRFGGPKIWAMGRGEGKRSNTLSPIPPSHDPTREFLPWDEEFSFLSDAAFELRENRNAPGPS